jgi:hypothetical protein
MRATTESQERSERLGDGSVVATLAGLYGALLRLLVASGQSELSALHSLVGSETGTTGPPALSHYVTER